MSLDQAPLSSGLAWAQDLQPSGEGPPPSPRYPHSYPHCRLSKQPEPCWSVCPPEAWETGEGVFALGPFSSPAWGSGVGVWCTGAGCQPELSTQGSAGCGTPGAGLRGWGLRPPGPWPTGLAMSCLSCCLSLQSEKTSAGAGTAGGDTSLLGRSRLRETAEEGEGRGRERGGGEGGGGGKGVGGGKGRKKGGARAGGGERTTKTAPLWCPPFPPPTPAP